MELDADIIRPFRFASGCSTLAVNKPSRCNRRQLRWQRRIFQDKASGLAGQSQSSGIIATWEYGPDVDLETRVDWARVTNRL
jgi:hypothetical protein